VVAALTSSTAVVAADTRTATARMSGAEVLLAERVDDARADRGIPRLDTRAGLSRVAQAWAEQMAREERLRHNPELGSEVTRWRFLGENVGYGPTWRAVHAAFMRSTPHRANILDHDFTEIGVAVVAGRDRVWVVEVLRRPRR
jgi:uncharacterized protein YkwD